MIDKFYKTVSIRDFLFHVMDLKTRTDPTFHLSVVCIDQFQYTEFVMFSERFLGARIGNYELSGYPDTIVAKGRRRPKMPYFCFHEYKKEQENKGDPAGQCLATMLVAQELNNNQPPIYGVIVKGLMWSFLVLKGKDYAIS